MQKESIIKEYEILNEIDEKDVTKMEDKKVLSEVDLEHYKKMKFLKKLDKSKKEYKEGKTYRARDVFEELREKYEY